MEVPADYCDELIAVADHAIEREIDVSVEVRTAGGPAHAVLSSLVDYGAERARLVQAKENLVRLDAALRGIARAATLMKESEADFLSLVAQLQEVMAADRLLEWLEDPLPAPYPWELDVHTAGCGPLARGPSLEHVLRDSTIFHEVLQQQDILSLAVSTKDQVEPPAGSWMAHISDFGSSGVRAATDALQARRRRVQDLLGKVVALATTPASETRDIALSILVSRLADSMFLREDLGEERSTPAVLGTAPKLRLFKDSSMAGLHDMWSFYARQLIIGRSRTRSRPLEKVVQSRREQVLELASYPEFSRALKLRLLLAAATIETVRMAEHARDVMVRARATPEDVRNLWRNLYQARWNSPIDDVALSFRFVRSDAKTAEAEALARALAQVTWTWKSAEDILAVLGDAARTAEEALRDAFTDNHFSY